MKRALSTFMFVLLLVGMLTLAFNTQPVKASGTIYIRADGSIDPPDAPISTFDNATYTFTDNIFDEIVVERDNIVVDGAGYTLQGTNAFESKGTDVTGRSNVTIKNTNIQNYWYGIYLSGSSNNSTVSGNNITNNGYGIVLYLSSNFNSISGNNITANNLDGIYLYSSSNNTVSGNNIANNGNGIGIDYSSNNSTVSGNNIANNGIGIGVDHSSINSSISGNNITNNRDGLMLNRSSNNIVSGNNITANNRFGIALDSFSNSSIVGNNITNNGEIGVYLVYSSNFNSISGNNITANNYYGVVFAYSDYNSISGNNVTNNGYGIALDSSSNSTVSGNNITNNGYGIWLVSSSNYNRFYHNNFVNNNIQVYSSDSANVWDDGYPSGGNYWSDYAGLDAYHGSGQDQSGGDGIGDTPYAIDAVNIDNYPLMEPWPASFQLTLVSPQNKTYYSSSIPVSLTLTKPASWIGYSLDSQQNMTITGNTIINVGDGSHQIIIYANDTSGNMVSSQIICFTVASSPYDPWKSSFIGLDGYPIVDFAVYNGSLYAAADNRLYVYDRSSWNVIDSPIFVTSLEPYGGKLVVGGKGGLYCYDGTSFDLVLSVPTYLRVLGTYNNTLYAGTMLGNPPKLYYCNGSADNPADWYIDTGFSTILNFSGPFGSIDSLAVYDNVMYVGSGGKLYSFDGTNWSIAASYDDVYAFLDLQAYNGKLYLATRDQGWRKPYYQGYSGFNGRVIEFDGENWTTVLDHDYWVYSLEVYDGKLYAGTANKILTYNGTDWETSFNATEGAYYAISMITYDSKIYVGMGNGYIFADPAPLKAEHEIIIVPEFPSATVLTVFMALTLIATAMIRKKRTRRHS